MFRNTIPVVKAVLFHTMEKCWIRPSPETPVCESQRIGDKWRGEDSIVHVFVRACVRACKEELAADAKLIRLSPWKCGLNFKIWVFYVQNANL